MLVQEVMDRAKIKEVGLALAWIEDAAAEMDSSFNDLVEREETNITKGTIEYSLPLKMLNLLNVAILDESLDKYINISRIVGEPMVSEDNTPPT